MHRCDQQRAEPIEAGAYAAMKQDILEGIRAALPVDGVLLALHGAGVADGTGDIEGGLLRIDGLSDRRPTTRPAAVDAVRDDRSGVRIKVDAIVSFAGVEKHVGQLALELPAQADDGASAVIA